jgi:hypothetical protein
MALERQGYRVVEAGSGPEAVDIVERDRTAIDLLVTDLVMPRQSGRELAAQLQKARPRLKVLFVSGHTDDTVLQPGGAASSTNFLAKPFTLAALAAKVRDVLDRPGPPAPPTSTGPGSRP